MTSHEVECLICGEICSGRLLGHLRKVHNLSTKDYRKEFPGASVLCKDEEESIRQRLIVRNKSEKQRSAISQRNRDPEFQRKCQEGCTEETRKAQAENMRKVSKRLWSSPEYRNAKSKEMSELMKRLSQDPEYRKLRSEIMKRTWKNPESASKMLSAPKCHPFGKQCSCHSVKFDRNFWCRSQGEYEFLKLCESLDQVTDVISEESSPIEYFDSDDVSHVYLPDFIVTTENQSYIVEIKYEDDLIVNHKDKVNAAVDFCKTNGLVYCYVNRFSGISKIRDLGFSSVEVLQRI